MSLPETAADARLATVAATVRAAQAGGDLETVVDIVRGALESGQYGLLEAVLEALRPADRADVIEAFDLDDQRELLERIDDEAAAEVLEWMADEDAAEVAGALAPAALAPILDQMDIDDAADVLGDLPPERAEATLQQMDDAVEAEVRELLAFDPETAGGRMTTDYVALDVDMTVADALAQLRHDPPDPATTYYLYVVDAASRLVGVVALRQLVVGGPEDRIGDLMDADVIHVRVTDDQETAARRMARYDLLVLPVVDTEGRLVGVLTHDDLVEVLEQEDTEDMFRLAGLGVEERPLDPTPQSVRHRLPWLVTNLGTQLVLVSMLKLFEPLMNDVTVLAVLFPLVTGNGGNVGSQTTTIMVRGMALGEVERSNQLRILRKEVLVGAINGLAVGILAAGVALVFARETAEAAQIAVAIFAAMVLNLAAGGMAGVLVPVTLRRLGLDPAVASSVLVTTVTDTLGAVFFLGLFTVLWSGR
jgi:magnesium transporter